MLNTSRETRGERFESLSAFCSRAFKREAMSSIRSISMRERLQGGLRHLAVRNHSRCQRASVRSCSHDVARLIKSRITQANAVITRSPLPSEGPSETKST